MKKWKELLEYKGVDLDQSIRRNESKVEFSTFECHFLSTKLAFLQFSTIKIPTKGTKSNVFWLYHLKQGALSVNLMQKMKLVLLKIEEFEK